MCASYCPVCKRYHFDGEYLKFCFESTVLLLKSKHPKRKYCLDCDRERQLKRLEVARQSCSVVVDF